MSPLGLDELANAYRRVQRLITLGMEDALEFDNEDKFELLDKDRNIVDAAFFVLMFGQLERRITELAVQKVSGQSSRHKSAMREAKFEKRLAVALGNNPAMLKEIEAWYALRNIPAHGSGIASGYEISAVLSRAQQIDKQLQVE